jgi:hypothetical protein
LAASLAESFLEDSSLSGSEIKVTGSLRMAPKIPKIEAKSFLIDPIMKISPEPCSFILMKIARLMRVGGLGNVISPDKSRYLVDGLIVGLEAQLATVSLKLSGLGVPPEKTNVSFRNKSSGF